VTLRRRVVLTLTLGLVLAVPAACLAHALGVQCKPEGDRILVEAYYDDNTPARRARVKVEDERGQTVLEGLTDEEGRFRFPRPAAGEYVVIVDDGAGHRAKVSLNGRGPTREEFTETPWLKAVIGLLAILGFAGALWVARRKRA
jgi:nickel transport protein